MYRVLVPIDRNERRATAQVRAVLDLPASGEELAVTLVHVVGEREEPREADVERMESARKAADLLTDAGVDVDRIVRSGGTDDEILAAAADVDADLIAMTGARAGLDGVVFGSTAQDVLDRADRPVLVVPDEE